MSKNFDVAIIGAGPAGLYCAYRLIAENKDLKIAVFEQGREIDSRKCPAIKQNKSCLHCSNCAIMSGVAGAGAFSDGKFPITNDFGGFLWEKCGKGEALAFMHQVDNLNRDFFYKHSSGSPYEWPDLYSTYGSSYKKICTQHNLHLLDAEIRHLGTDISQFIFRHLYQYLKDQGVVFTTNTHVDKIKKVENIVNVDSLSDRKYHWEINCSFNDNDINTSFNASYVVVAAGRSGSKWVESLCEDLDIPTHSNRVDIGIRFECPNEIWNHITEKLYEAKIVYKTKTYEDEVRTFCMNPSGYVVTEHTKSGITVNGHSFEAKDKKSNNTNFALLVSKTLTEPFDNSNEYGEAIIKLSNMLGGGVIVQRYGDLIRGRRSTKDHIAHNSVTPTLNAEPGDLSLVLPKRILDDIMEMIEKLDHLVPGMVNDDNLLYGVECKFYNMTVESKNNCEALGYPGLYFAGDGAGYTHSLSQAAANGLYVAEDILSRINPNLL